MMTSSSCEHLLCSYYGLNDEVYSDVKIIYNEELFFCGIRVDKVDFRRYTTVYKMMLQYT